GRADELAVRVDRDLEPAARLLIEPLGPALRPLVEGVIGRKEVRQFQLDRLRARRRCQRKRPGGKRCRETESVNHASSPEALLYRIIYFMYHYANREASRGGGLPGQQPRDHARGPEGATSCAARLEQEHLWTHFRSGCTLRA